MEECPHCLRWLSRRQVDRHLTLVEHNFDLSSSDSEMSDGDDPNNVDDPEVGHDPGAIENPGVINNPGAANDPGAVDDLGAGSQSERSDEGMLALHTWVFC
jgi:hypothetical protein